MGETIRLREVTPADLDLFFEYEQDPEALLRSHFTPRDRAAFMTHWATTVLGDPTVFVRTVTVDGETAGNIVSWWREDRRFLGYWLARKYWGRGVATQALTLFLTRETTRPVWADPHTANTASIRLLENHGFRRTGSDWNGPDEYAVLVLASPEPRQLP
ncbi:GNAT family N-acetyltransferase [Nocardia brasiliensis]|uniref:GCN5-like N-acetyltransferase n=1 Tax=Nocardia brasiliensis (strain ATCC 700358 / HUJEG-1) TaxID=1133849 RepID=K0F2N9_NOCB7|nr:GNAT family N-acetyltransferase [Nocardia brasiliensis]AFU03400.1 GCN5-like N-acetyltransferase [Nocardia brasiliensis ATCC 700358]